MGFTLGYFQDQTGESPEQPGLNAEADTGLSRRNLLKVPRNLNYPMSPTPSAMLERRGNSALTRTTL